MRLYHYTNNHALINMVKKQQIWFTDVRFLNDSREYRHACDMLVRDVNTGSSRHRQEWINHGCTDEAFDGMVGNLVRGCSYSSVVSHAERNGFLPYVFCLSEKPDALSQWRAYGNGELCVGFNADKLRERTNSKLGKVVYKEVGASSAGEASDIIDNFFKFHLRHIQANGRIDAEVYHDGAIDIFGKLFKAEFFWLYKDAGFKDEAEHRLVVQPYPGVSNIFLDTRGRYPSLRCKSKIKDNSDENHLVDCIEEIICGPGADRERCMASFRFLGRKYRKHIPIKFSEIPYRAG